MLKAQEPINWQNYMPFKIAHNQVDTKREALSIFQKRFSSCLPFCIKTTQARLILECERTTLLQKNVTQTNSSMPF